MRFLNMIYLSQRRLDAWRPDRASMRVAEACAEAGPSVSKAKVTARADDDDVSRRLRRVRKHLETQIKHFAAPDVRPGGWVYVDLEMGWGTSHADSRLPDTDDVVFFTGSGPHGHAEAEPVDLMLCGSTEHLLQRAICGSYGVGDPLAV